MLISNETIGQDKDTLYLTNGQILIGELKSISLGRVDFDADDISLLSIKLYKIKTIHAGTHMFRLETVNKELFFSHLKPSTGGKVIIRADAADRVIDIEEISILLPLRGKTNAFWQGKASLGYSFTRSSDIGRLNADYSLACITRKIEVVTQGSIIITQTDSTSEAENASASIIGSYSFNPVWDASVFLNYQRNLELGLARRYQEGAGVGISFLQSLHTRGKAIVGIVFGQEKNTEGKTTPTQVEIPLIIAFNFFKFSKPDMTLNVRQSLFAGVTQAGRFRQEGQINLSLKIIGDLSINIQLYDNFDNQPPGDSPEKFDYGIVFGVSYKFSQ